MTCDPPFASVWRAVCCVHNNRSQCSPAPSTLQVLTPPSNKPIDRSYWCMNVNHMWPDDPNSGFGGWAAGYLWPAVDFGIWRTWDSSITWQTIQPTSTTSFDWTRMDRAAGQARSRGQRIMFTLGQSPPWASSNPTEPAVYGEWQQQVAVPKGQQRVPYCRSAVPVPTL